jgi:carboxymethylenebutenolidase
MGEIVSFAANGGKASGYLARPSSGKGPGVLVIQEWWGLNDQIKGVADMLASEGFNALAPDCYFGRSAGLDEPDEAQKLMMGLSQDAAAKLARGSAQHLAAHPSTSSRKVGVIGFCMGGGLALLTAAEAADLIGACVDCYGVGQNLTAYARRIKAPVLALFGGQDHTVDAAGLETALNDAGVSFEKHVYPDAGHAFLNEQRPETYRPEDAKDAWGRIIPFLRRHLA